MKRKYYLQIEIRYAIEVLVDGENETVLIGCLWYPFAMLTKEKP